MATTPGSKVGEVHLTRLSVLPVAVLLSVGLVACSSNDDGGDGASAHASSSASDSPDAQPSGAQTPSPTEPVTPLPTATDAETTDTGDVVGDVGEPVGLRQNGKEAFTLTLNEVEKSETCPSRLGGEVQADHEFLILDVTAKMSEDYVDEGMDEPFIATGSDVFFLFDEDGAPVESAHSVKAYECFDIEEQMSPVMYPGDEFSGKIVLETSVDSGRIVYSPWGVEGSGWAWKF